jgi:hypothetical protein
VANQDINFYGEFKGRQANKVDGNITFEFPLINGNTNINIIENGSIISLSDLNDLIKFQNINDDLELIDNDEDLIPGHTIAIHLVKDLQMTNYLPHQLAFQFVVTNTSINESISKDSV